MGHPVTSDESFGVRLMRESIERHKVTRGRPTTGKVRELRIPDELYEPLKEEARQQGAPIAEMLRRILAGRYEEEK